MTRVEVPRPDLEQQLIDAVEAPRPVMLTGPPGAGKTTLLEATARSLARRGFVPVSLDLMAAVSSPERFVSVALGALDASSFGARLPEASSIRRHLGSGRAGAARAVSELLALWAGLVEAQGRPVVLLLDEVTEIRSLAYFDDLREVHVSLGRALLERPRATLLATSFPTQARRLWPDFDVVEAMPLSTAEVDGASDRSGTAVDSEAVIRATWGWPGYVSLLLDELRRGPELASAWTAAMSRGGALERACRHTYETLLLRCRGYGMAKAVLGVVAEQEGLTLSEMLPKLGRSPGAIRDYLGWLLDVDALKQVKKRYHYVDGLLRLFVKLHASGAPPSVGDLRSAAAEVVGPSAPIARSRGRRDDSLMEID
jgi:hypothetical protein